MTSIKTDLVWLSAQVQIESIIDIGANDGSYGEFLARLFGAKTVHAIEPNPEHSDILRRRGFMVHACAVGNGSSELMGFNVSASDGASSLRPLTDDCLAEYPEVRVVKRIQVPVLKLDDIFAETLPSGLLIKIDAQGAEREIIEGGRETFERADVVLIEQTFVPLYTGQALFNDIHRLLDEIGFELKGFKTQHMSKIDARPLFAHCVYVNRNK